VKNWEREFLKLAGFMLLARYQLVNGISCTYVKGHTRSGKEPLYTQMSYLGYKDTIAEMHLITIEMRISK
jgi:hypothetical protein